MGQAGVNEESLAELIGDDSDAPTTSFLASLPAQQRLTLLLVYGERFDYVDAGRVLDISADMIAARLIRISTMFADRLSAAGQPQVGASMGALYPRELS
jgi:RNA polymerase sigma-70 factor (ECF subfamily)